LSVSGNANEHLCVEAEEVLLNMKFVITFTATNPPPTSTVFYLLTPVVSFLSGVTLGNRTRLSWSSYNSNRLVRFWSALFKPCWVLSFAIEQLLPSY
jgi:hypothetical protein